MKKTALIALAAILIIIIGANAAFNLYAKRIVKQQCDQLSAQVDKTFSPEIGKAFFQDNWDRTLFLLKDSNQSFCESFIRHLAWWKPALLMTVKIKENEAQKQELISLLTQASLQCPSFFQQLNSALGVDTKTSPDVFKTLCDTWDKAIEVYKAPLPKKTMLEWMQTWKTIDSK